MSSVPCRTSGCSGRVRLFFMATTLLGYRVEASVSPLDAAGSKRFAPYGGRLGEGSGAGPDPFDFLVALALEAVEIAAQLFCALRDLRRVVDPGHRRLVHDPAL